ncbi:hypothetical protein [Chitinophaga pinensis]|uniref:Lipoprotein n=1 Tax=Chitinophaga pinensis (strain ATCC 43595 / DSM 2588 / LMG 13176 / NBRC 15968 / NCIMB 11800 / UQM 2034) TaxID=485918 RepID=A0A979GAS1_CHIPD|nr:hypothetical protein [Chitinophaga pinensis]ACU64074.1 hypothetical protein Cpin_6670 [Chitinophaga pinensis DSM 2588]
MKYIIFSALLLLFSCASQENKSNSAVPSKDSTVAPVAVTPIETVPKEEPQILLDGISAGTALTQKQMILYFHADTTYYELFNVSSSLTSIDLLGDSLMIAVVHQNDNNCAKSELYVINRYSFDKISEKEIEVSCDMDDQSQDHVSFVFTGKQEFVITTETYDKGVNSDGPSATVKEYWTILPDGQFEKRSDKQSEKHS